MPSVVPRIPLEDNRRKRKAHAKSRKGCGTCKLRRVKCDEGRPKCRKCVSYGVDCDYNGSKSPLCFPGQVDFHIDLARGEATIDFSVAPEKPPVSLNSMAASMINHSLLDSTNDRGDGLVMAGLPHLHRFSAWSFTDSDMEVMTRFQTRTVSTVGTKESASTYRDCIAHLAFSHPFLMHMVLSLTLMHDAHLATSHTSNLAINFQKSSLTHWNTATKLFNNLLSRPIPPSHRDAIWATGALLGTASMAYIESSSPEDAWPLKAPDPNDLNWLRLSEGKRAIWILADPTRPESIFHQLGKSMNHRLQPAWITNPEFDSVPERLARLFGITRGDTPRSNVYYVPLLCVLNVEAMTLTQELVVPFLMFLIYMESEFRGLLESKDPRGMLLLLWWFRKVEGGDVWWMSRRAKIEGRAIEIWLDRWYGGEEGLIRMFEEVMDGDVGGKEMDGGMEDAAGLLMGYPGWGMERVERVDAQVVM